MQQTARNGPALWEGSAMETKLSEQIQATLDALALAQTQAALVTKATSKQNISFGLDYSHMDDDIAHVTSKLRFLKRLTERRERAEEATTRTDAPERDETPE
jgi:hypothetical protein